MKKKQQHELKMKKLLFS